MLPERRAREVLRRHVAYKNYNMGRSLFILRVKRACSLLLVLAGGLLQVKSPDFVDLLTAPPAGEVGKRLAQTSTKVKLEIRGVQ